RGPAAVKPVAGVLQVQRAAGPSRLSFEWNGIDVPRNNQTVRSGRSDPSHQVGLGNPPDFDPLLRDLEPEALELGGQVVDRDQIAVRTYRVERDQAARNIVEVTGHLRPTLPRPIATRTDRDSRFFRPTKWARR